MSGDFYKKVAANDMESANPESKHQTATQPRRLRFGKEEQGRVVSRIFRKLVCRPWPEGSVKDFSHFGLQPLA